MKLGALFSLLLAGEITYGLLQLGGASFSNDPAAKAAISNVGQIGVALFTTHSFAFEVTSILILVAMVGAVVIAGKPRSEH
jgi:NADH-quinone oxidoreductase subunit J